MQKSTLKLFFKNKKPLALALLYTFGNNSRD